MKGFIEVTEEFSGDVILVHYTQIHFRLVDKKIAVFNGRGLKETYEEIKQLIKNAQ